MKKISFLLCMLIFIAFSSAHAESTVKWLPLKEGLEKSKVEKKPMIVDFFYGQGCRRCEELQKDTYEDPSIAKKIMDDFIPVRVDLRNELTEEEEALGNQFDYKKDCMLLFLDINGDVIKDPFGKKLCFMDTVEPEQFIAYLDMIKAESVKIH